MCVLAGRLRRSLYKRLRFKREAILKEEVKCKCDYTNIVAMSLDLRERKS